MGEAVVAPATYEKADVKVVSRGSSLCMSDSTQNPAMVAQHDVSRNDSSTRAKLGLKGNGRSSDLETFLPKAGFDADHRDGLLHEGEAEAPVSGETAFRTSPVVDSARWDSWAVDAALPGSADTQQDCRVGTGLGNSCTANYRRQCTLEGYSPSLVVETTSAGEHIAVDCRRSARLAAALRCGIPVYDK